MTAATIRDLQGERDSLADDLSDVTEQRDLARDAAVALEQELAALQPVLATCVRLVARYQRMNAPSVRSSHDERRYYRRQVLRAAGELERLLAVLDAQPSPLHAGSEGPHSGVGPAAAHTGRTDQAATP